MARRDVGNGDGSQSAGVVHGQTRGLQRQQLLPRVCGCGRIGCVHHDASRGRGGDGISCGEPEQACPVRARPPSVDSAPHPIPAAHQPLCPVGLATCFSLARGIGTRRAGPRSTIPARTAAVGWHRGHRPPRDARAPATSYRGGGSCCRSFRRKNSAESATHAGRPTSSSTPFESGSPRPRWSAVTAPWPVRGFMFLASPGRAPGAEAASGPLSRDQH
jgi:hypothetical protein